MYYTDTSACLPLCGFHAMESASSDPLTKGMFKNYSIAHELSPRDVPRDSLKFKV